MNLSKARIEEINALAEVRRKTYFPPGVATFNVFDVGIAVHPNEERPKERDYKSETVGVKKIFNEIIDIMKAHGWTVGKDPYIAKDFNILSPNHRLAKLGELHAKMEVYPAGGSIKFYPTYNPDHRAGPNYGFKQFERMTYLDKKRMQLIQKKVTALLLSKGYIDRSEANFSGREEIEYRMRSSWHFKEYDTNAGLAPCLQEAYGSQYNAKDKQDQPMKNGDLKYYYDYDGRLICGRVYYNINNMWWVLAGGVVRNEANFRLFDFDKSKHPLRRPRVRNIERHLEAAVKEQNFERAIRLRDQLKKLAEAA